MKTDRSASSAAPENAPASPGDHILRSYSETKCPTQGDSRRAWLREVEQGTRGFRAGRALDHRGRARFALLEGNDQRADWHFARAKGQVERFDRVDGCGEREIVIGCGDCGHEMQRVEARCTQPRLCVSCRGRRAYRYRAMIRAARARALARTKRMRLPGAPGGAWLERFLTLTLPHSGDVVRDLRALAPGWRAFRKALREFFRHEHGLSDQLLDDIAFVRVIEVTPGEASEGHAHLHVYMISPFIPHEVARHLWGTALRKLGYVPPVRTVADVVAGLDGMRRRQLERVLVTRRGSRGRPLTEMYWPVVDVRTCHGDVENELVKYLIKDAERDGSALKPIDPALYARVYQGLEGVRTIATSRHFFERSDAACFCEECGSTRVGRRVAPRSTAEASE